jgi:hypothetical protein
MKQLPFTLTLWDEKAEDILACFGCSEELLTKQFSELAAKYQEAVNKGEIKVTEDMINLFKKEEFFDQFIIASGFLYFLQNFMIGMDYMKGQEEGEDGA